MKKLNPVIKTVISSVLLITVLFLFSNTGNASNLIAKGKTSVASQKAPNSTLALSSKFNTTNRSASGAGKCGGSDKKADAKVKTAKTKINDAKCGTGKCGSGKCGGADKKADAKVKKANAKVNDAKCGSAKCSEGKSGGSDKKIDAKVKDAKAKTAKVKDAKRGAGK